ncbi:MAG TPA: hypothetical protein VN702_13905 [Acetobacteraceae bacterium]|nr:hypothetical protein [Acetobacteraceae bacterium]
MAYEYPTTVGVLRLFRDNNHWAMQFRGRRSTMQWPSPDAAAAAIARHRSGLREWDDARSQDAPADVLDWRALGESL